MAFNSKKLFGENIAHSCDYCQNCIVEGGRNFCKYKKSINKKGKCSKFTYNPILRKVELKTIDKYSKEDFDL